MNRLKRVDRLNDRLSEHLQVVLKCTVESPQYGRLLLASPPHTRYPYVYPRDASSAVALFRRLACSPHGYDVAASAFQIIESTARFVKDVCKGSGGWGQRYSLQGEDKSIYRQEDNVAHGMAILSNYLLTAHQLQKDVKDVEGFLGCLQEAAAWSLEHLYQPELNLFHSTTAIHESALEQGYTLWVNFTFLYALSLLHEVARKVDEKGIISSRLLEFRNSFLYSVSELFISGNRYARRIDAGGRIDFRPDFTLLTPFYYGFLHYQPELHNSARFAEKHLWDPELGMMMRYLPFHDDFAVHVHAGNGPWLQYTAILAQYHYWKGDRKRGDELLDYIDRYRNEDGEIPEHLSTCSRFERFIEKEWQTGIDFEKEFHKPILIEGIEFDKILEEANNMSESYRATAQKCMYRGRSAGGGFIHFALPLMWSHVEYARALLVRAGDWWKMK